MLLRGALNLSIFALATLPPAVLAKRGGGGHGGGSSGSSGNSGGNSLPGFGLKPIDAAIFAFCVVFTIVTALQAVQAIKNVRQRISQQPPCIASPDFSVGRIFPTTLILSALTIVIAYALHGALWAALYNTKARTLPAINDALPSAMRATSYLGDIFLVVGILALLSHRESLLTNTSRAALDIKMILDAVLTVILLALSMGTVALNSARLATRADAWAANNIYVAYISFLFIAALDITISSVILYVRAKRSASHINDHKVTTSIAFIISPLFIIYTLCAIVLWAVQNGKNGPTPSFAEADLIGLSVGCIIEFIIIAVCLRFGMPVIPKRSKGSGQEPVYEPVYKGYQA